MCPICICRTTLNLRGRYLDDERLRALPSGEKRAASIALFQRLHRHNWKRKEQAGLEYLTIILDKLCFFWNITLMWSVEFLDENVLAEMEGQPNNIKAKFERIVQLIEANGLERVHEPYIKHLDGKLWEMRMKGRDTIARAIYVTRS